MKKTLIIILAFSYSIADSQIFDLSKLIKKNDPSIFKIIAYDFSDNSIIQGSGIFISTDGASITNYHVLENADSAFIITFDNKK